METFKKGIKSDDPERAWMNKNFVILWKHADEKKAQLIGAGRYHLLVGEDFKKRHFEKVRNSTKPIITFKIRNRLIIQFRSK